MTEPMIEEIEKTEAEEFIDELSDEALDREEAKAPCWPCHRCGT
jgi:hypothetical protein